MFKCSHEDLMIAEQWYRDTYPQGDATGIGPLQLRAFVGGMRRAFAMEEMRAKASSSDTAEG